MCSLQNTRGVFHTQIIKSRTSRASEVPRPPPAHAAASPARRSAGALSHGNVPHFLNPRETPRRHKLRRRAELAGRPLSPPPREAAPCPPPPHPPPPPTRPASNEQARSLAAAPSVLSHAFSDGTDRDRIMVSYTTRHVYYAMSVSVCVRREKDPAKGGGGGIL